MHDDSPSIQPRDPGRDPKLEALLRVYFGPGAEDDPPDWPALRRRIVADAALRLGAGTDAWWTYAAAWARPAIPAGLAASVILAVGLAASSRTSATASKDEGSTDVAVAVVVEEVLVSAASEVLPAGTLLAPAPATLWGDLLLPME